MLRKNAGACWWVLAGVLVTVQAQAARLQQQAGKPILITAVAANDPASSTGEKQANREKRVVIKAIESDGEGERLAGKELPWLGLSTDEASEVLTSQLGLEHGVGLVVSYVASNSPAAEAGLQKNDVLIEFENQELVHPAQLRKLVQARKEGDTVKLTYFRGGKRESLTVKIGKTTQRHGFLEGENAWRGDLEDLRRQLKDLPIREEIQKQIMVLRDSLGNINIDQKKVQEEIRRSLEEAGKALEQAVRQATNSKWALDPAGKALRELEKSRELRGKNATVTVRSTGKHMKSVVKSDDEGTIVIVSNPKPHLTAHDKDGKLIFDGEIDTSEQQDKVPRELWERVEPMLDQMNLKAEEDEK